LLEQNRQAEHPVDAFEVWRWNYVHTLNSRSGGLMAEPNPYILEESRPYPAYTRYLNTLLFRRRPEVYFENRVHETVANRIQALGLHSVQAPFVIHHFGFVEGPKQMRKDKNEYYHQLGLQKVKDHPEDAWANYELGLSELEHHHNPSEARVWLDRSIALDPTNLTAWVYSGICLTRLGRLGDALQRLQHAEQGGLRTALLAEAMGDVFFHDKQPEKAIQYYAQVEQRSSSGAAAVSGLVDCKRGACMVRLGDAEKGLALIQQAIARDPEAEELYEIWAAATLESGDVVAATRIARQRLTMGKPPVGSYIIAAVLEAHQSHWQQALEILLDGQKRYPEEVSLQREAVTAREKLQELKEKGESEK
jgi:tetratricopeptide (TPR) repeat protein